MKRFLALTLLLVAVLAAGAVFAQQPTNMEFLIDAAARGKTYQTAAARDTLHSTQTKASSVAATKWRGPLPIYSSKGTGAWAVSKYSMPNGWYMYARKPFNFKALFPSGDSTGVYCTNVDTTFAMTHNASSLYLYPVYYYLKSPVTQLRVIPATSDTVYIVPYVLK